MGLYVSFTPEDLGYPTTLAQEVLGEEIVVDVSYFAACEAFVSTFLSEAMALVPVDTGYLQSTISASTNGFLCEAEALADYAQYVEYGTWKMDAQPYFVPAVQAGIQAFQVLAGEALSQAQEELKDMCQAVIDSATEAFGDGTLLGDMGGMLIGAAMLWLAFPILVNLYGIMETLHPGDHKFNDNTIVDGTNVEVIIT